MRLAHKLRLGTGGVLGGLLPETKAYLAAMTTQPSKGQIIAINERIKGLLPVWQKLVRMYFFDGHSEQAARINVINPAEIANNVNIPVTTHWSAYLGYKGISGGYINTGLNAFTNSTITADSLHVGAWVSDSTTSLQYVMGAYNTYVIALGINTGSTKMRMGLNCTVGEIREAPQSTLNGHFVASREDGGNGQKMWQDKNDIGPIGSIIKGSEVNRNIHISNISGANYHFYGRIKIAHIGVNLVQADVDAIYDAILNNPITAG